MNGNVINRDREMVLIEEAARKKREKAEALAAAREAARIARANRPSRYRTDPEFKARQDQTWRNWVAVNGDYNLLRKRILGRDMALDPDAKKKRAAQKKAKLAAMTPEEREADRLKRIEYKRRWREKQRNHPVYGKFFRMMDSWDPRIAARGKQEYTRIMTEMKKKKRIEGMATLMEKCSERQIAALKRQIMKRAKARAEKKAALAQGQEGKNAEDAN